MIQKHFGRYLLATTLSASLTLAIATAADADKAPLTIKWPMPTLKGTPDDLPTGPNVEKLPEKAPAMPAISKGAVNVAKGKKVNASDKNPISGSLDMITDGLREAYDDQVVEMRKGTQWVQIDLESEHEIQVVVLWNDHRWIQLYRDVILQVADDADFTKNVRTVYNNDTDNSSGLGIGTDKEYFETQWGRVVEAKGVKARYLRSYSKGSNQSALNCRQEIEVYAVPAK